MMDDNDNSEKGYLYILGVKDIDLPVSKIGRTARDPSVRCAEINHSSTGDFLWEVTYQIAVNDCLKLESLVHSKLSPLRQKRREFFNLGPDDAIRAVQSILLSAPEIREVTTAQIHEIASVPSKANTLHRQPATRTRKDFTYAHLLDGFTETLGVKGRPFGQLNRPVFGISDGREGVQWNLAIYPKDDKAQVGVNLEGMKYRDWPIAKLIKSEMENPALVHIIPHMQDAESITVQFVRDAWQATSRPSIREEYIGGREYSLFELTADLWHEILVEALDCLDQNRNYLGRARQLVTPVRKSNPNAQREVMQVSPHLRIWTPIVPNGDLLEELSSAIDLLMPIHGWASKASET